MLPISDHLNMIGTQTMTNTFLESSPLHRLLGQPRPPRDIKKPAKAFFEQWIPPTATQENVKQTKRDIHTNITRDSIARMECCRLTNALPPEIDPGEASLSRKIRTDLARLRSSWHPSLASYLHRIQKRPDALCPKCGLGEETVTHYLLFCPAHSLPRERHSITSLEQLWTKPLQVAAYIAETSL